MLKIALLGCGRIAKRHADLLGNNQIQGACLAALCDTNVERAYHLAQPFNVPVFSEYTTMMTTIQPDVVVVLTPSGLHAQHVQQLAPYGKHIVVEKPMALTLADADAMIHACNHYGIELFVIKQNRFNVPVVHLRKALEAGRFGKLVLGTIRVRWCRTQSYYNQDAWRGTWAYDGGVLANQASHHVDLLQWMMGDVESVVAKATTALAKIEAEDTAVAILKFKNGALGVIEATTATRPKDLEGSLSILGEGGTVEIGGFAVNEMKVWQFANPLPTDTDVIQNYSVNPPNVYGFGHQAYYNQVVQCLTKGSKNEVDGIAGRQSLELITAIYQSVETGQEVRLFNNSLHSKLGKNV